MKAPKLFNSPIWGSSLQYCLCLSEKQFMKFGKELGLDPKDMPTFVNKGADATTHFFENNGFSVAAICMKKGATKVQRVSLLVHEIMHVWQEVLIRINENKPGEEIEAYSIQEMVQDLLPQLGI